MMFHYFLPTVDHKTPKLHTPLTTATTAAATYSNNHNSFKLPSSKCLQVGLRT